eukprot:CAMPEP_0113946768 /NCGR_PEP_ID=MMETSP1339-20121228/60044_1 /TAXON_ID=94617 /ORGANISM="Fibrocapsa japonica" /LENGTH=197 /DNA_ID=CAMNT_0000953009 /DNA_START=100 /DNA_END=693 /DNA_ORIENTATION=- /assembly_acc=CAM_ASM_000762
MAMTAFIAAIVLLLPITCGILLVGLYKVLEAVNDAQKRNPSEIYVQTRKKIIFYMCFVCFHMFASTGYFISIIAFKPLWENVRLAFTFPVSVLIAASPNVTLIIFRSRYRGDNSNRNSTYIAASSAGTLSPRRPDDTTPACDTQSFFPRPTYLPVFSRKTRSGGTNSRNIRKIHIVSSPRPARVEDPCDTELGIFTG